MRHKVDEFHSFRQNTSGSCQVASISNQNGRLCLPLLSENQKVIWVHSDHINLQLDGVAELDAAFDRFPYLTQRQTVVLAKRCSLHPDQVKVWFMVQRLRYGISWDYEDILEVQKKLALSRDKEEAHVAEEVRRDEKKGSKEVKESDGKTGEAREEEREEVKEQNGGDDTKRNTVEEGKENAEKKPKKVGKKRTKQGKEKEWPASIQTQEKLCTAQKKISKASKRSHSDMCVGSGPGPNETPSPTSETDPVLKSDVSSVPRNTDVKSSAKTRSQLAALKSAFCNSQYPEPEVLDHLAQTTGLQYQALVEWFKDKRNYVKKFKPHWMNAEQHSRALANIGYRQYLRKLATAAVSHAGIRRQTTTEEQRPGRDAVRGAACP